MRVFEPVDKEEAKQIFLRVCDKSVDDILAALGAPCRVIEPQGEERFRVWSDGVEVRRILGFATSTKTVYRFWVYECADGSLAFHAQGKEITKENRST